MNEIVLTHNGISYTKEDIIEMLDLVMEIVGAVEYWVSFLVSSLVMAGVDLVLVLVDMVLVQALDSYQIKSTTTPEESS
jgi:hypothetical protein